MSSTALEELEEILKKATERIHSAKLQNEAQTRQVVILPILRGLGWDDTNPSECFPEYPMSYPKYSKSYPKSGRVDYALCRTDTDPPTPLVFIEAKGPGRIGEEGEDQLFHYAYYRQGVPLLVLTDGDIWHFYLTAAEGLPAERRFYRAVLSTVEKTAEYARSFDCFLSKKQVESGEAQSQA